MIEMQDNGPEARTITEQADRSVYRSVYLPLLRGVTPKSLEAFDPVAQTLVTGQRDATTVPGQALFLLNSSFVRRQSLSLAEELLAKHDRRTARRIQQAYRLTLGRAPSKQELIRADKFLGEYEVSYRRLPPAETLTPVKPTGEAAKPATVPADLDDLDRAGETATEEVVQPRSPKEAAWMSLVQALYASAEFRFVR